MNIDTLREEIEALDSEMRAALYVEGTDELRDDVTPEVRSDVAAKLEQRNAKVELLKTHEAIASAEQVPARSVRVGAPNVITQRDALDVVADRSAKPAEIADAATRALEGKVSDPENMAHVRQVLKRHQADEAWSRGVLLRSTELYADAWAKLMTGREAALSAEERTVLGVSTNANGKYLLPTMIDPTIILTNNGTSNVIRGLARVVTITNGAAAWNGVTSAGVTASWDGEVVEVSDDSPTFAQPSIPTVRAQAFVQASISATEDITNLADDVLMMFADARDRLEGAAHATGLGTTQPTGVFTAVHAVTASRVTSTTAATIGLVDLSSVYTGLAVRHRGRATWLANPLYTVAIKALGTAISASYSGDLTMPVAGRILGAPLVESDDAPTTQTTTALDDEVIFGDFSKFVIVDRPAGMSVEYVPHLFNTANNLPDGRRGWFATWRNGSDVTDANAFRLLVDKTTA